MSNRFHHTLLALLFICGTLSVLRIVADDEALTSAPVASFDELDKQYREHVFPLLETYCVDCHSADALEGDLDLGRFDSLAVVRQEPRVWEKVAEMLDLGEMPPADAEQPARGQRSQLRSWIARYLHAESLALAGDPGEVVLRRLNNAEYTYTIQDLTGVDLDPAREFPSEGAAGEGFTNAGGALSMSPGLLDKYLAAGKEVAAHAVLLTDGFRFSPHTTRRDWTDKCLVRIRSFYREFVDTRNFGDGTEVGTKYLGNPYIQIGLGGRLPLEWYFQATLDERDALQSGNRSTADVAADRGLNARYLNTLWTTLNGNDPSIVLDELRARWRRAAPEDVEALVNRVADWQRGLWTFRHAGQIGTAGGPTRWLEPINPFVTEKEILFAPAESRKQVEREAAIFSLVANDAGDGNHGDFVIWERPRLLSAGCPDLLLADVPRLVELRRQALVNTEKYLAAAEEVIEQLAVNRRAVTDVDALAARSGLDAVVLQSWLAYLGIEHVEKKTPRRARVGVPKVGTTVLADVVEVRGKGGTFPLITDTPGGSPTAAALSDGRAARQWYAKPLHVPTYWQPVVHCDLTTDREIDTVSFWNDAEARPDRVSEMTLRFATEAEGIEGFGASIADQKLDVLEQYGNATEQVVALDGRRTFRYVELTVNAVTEGSGRIGFSELQFNQVRGVPRGSVLDRWLAADSSRRPAIAREVSQLLTGDASREVEDPDLRLHRELTSLRGPLFSRIDMSQRPKRAENRGSQAVTSVPFATHPRGDPLDKASLCVRAPGVVEIKLPPDLAQACDFIVTARLDPQEDGSVQVEVVRGPHTAESKIRLAQVIVEYLETTNTFSPRRIITYEQPVIAAEGSDARERLAAAFDEFRSLFPAAVCYSQIVPVDDVLTVALFYREDDHLQRLMLDDTQRARLDQLWDELHFVSHSAFLRVDALESLRETMVDHLQYAAIEPLGEHFLKTANTFREKLIAAEAPQLDALVEFARRAYRGGMTEAEADELCGLYQRLRDEGMPHEEAFRLTLARVFVASPFLYRLEDVPQDPAAAPVSDWELASRLGYFLWSSLPDEELADVARNGRLTSSGAQDGDAELLRQTRRMLRDTRVRRLAVEFGCQYLHIHDFDPLAEKSEKHFPEFAELRGDMYEESILFFTDLFQRDGSLLDLLDADYTFVNDRLARFYGIEGSQGAGWRRQEGIQAHGRGGILALATTLAQQSGTTRTSPILRGNWVSEVLLGEKLPNPPDDVPQLSDTVPTGLTERQLIERHSSEAACARCHVRIDPFGFALEHYDGIGRRRERDAGGLPIDARTTLPDGTQIEGLPGLRDYLLESRRDQILRQFCRKLLGYALGREVQLSDRPLLDSILERLAGEDYRVSVAVETIVLSDQFRMIRAERKLASSP